MTRVNGGASWAHGQLLTSSSLLIYKVGEQFSLPHTAGWASWEDWRGGLNLEHQWWLGQHSLADDLQPEHSGRLNVRYSLLSWGPPGWLALLRPWAWQHPRITADRSSSLHLPTPRLLLQPSHLAWTMKLVPEGTAARSDTPSPPVACYDISGFFPSCFIGWCIPLS